MPPRRGFKGKGKGKFSKDKKDKGQRALFRRRKFCRFTAEKAESLAKAQERGAKLEGFMLQITQKAGVDGRLFGSVTNYDIVEALKQQGHEVERSQVRMPQGPLKQVGDYPIQIALHTDVAVTIKVSVLGEQ